MNEIEIGTVLAPLAAFWVALEGFMKAATFANGMRDTIISGVQGTSKLTLAHRKTMFLDWRASMMAFILAAFMFAFIVVLLALDLDPNESYARYGVYGVVAFTSLGGILFAITGFFDYRTISESLAKGALEAQPGSAGAEAGRG